MSTTEAREQAVAGLRHLVQVSCDLREAMLARDPARIQDVVSRQESLRVLGLPTPGEGEHGWQQDDEVMAAAKQLQHLQESNRLLASAFLGLYRGAFAAGSVGAGKADRYGRDGQILPMEPSYMLVRQTC